MRNFRTLRPGALRPETRDPENLRPGTLEAGTLTPRNLKISPWDLKVTTQNLRLRILRAGP